MDCPDHADDDDEAQTLVSINMNEPFDAENPVIVSVTVIMAGMLTASFCDAHWCII